MADKPKKHPGGRPRTKTPKEYSAEQVALIDEMAEAQCKDTTIAEALGVDINTFKTEFSRRCKEKRAEGKTRVLRAQYRAAVGADGTPTDRIWWGKQHLDQRDAKQEVEHTGNVIVEIVTEGGRSDDKDNS